MNHLIIIPTYNEAENIKSMADTLFSLYPEKSILVVDDSSPDGTGRIVNNLKSEYKNLYLLTQEKKSGLGKAYIKGLNWGLNNGFDLFTTIDCDFSHPPEAIKTAIELINKGADCACGSRYVPSGDTKETNWLKKYLSIGGNIYARVLLGRELLDWTEGFNTYTKYALEKIQLSTVESNGYVFQAEMKYKAIKGGCKVLEFPINFQERVAGKSKMDIKIITEAFFMLIKLKFSNI